MADSDNFKAILRLFNYGLFIVTCSGDEGPRAATVSWASQVSFEPKQVAVALRKGTSICEGVQKCGRFGLHVVGENQPELARAFFKVLQVGPSDIAGFRYRISPTGVPILDAAIAWMECEVVEQAGHSGDHVLFVATVAGGDIQAPGIRPLALHDTVWHYGG